MIVCWRCGSSLEKLTLPLSRLDECPGCTVQLHVCRMCVSFNPAVSKPCSEDDAEEVREKERANYCDYFTPAANSFDSKTAKADMQAAAALGSLFGDAATPGAANSSEGSNDPLSQAAEDLFRK